MRREEGALRRPYPHLSPPVSERELPSDVPGACCPRGASRHGIHRSAQKRLRHASARVRRQRRRQRRRRTLPLHRRRLRQHVRRQWLWASQPALRRWPGHCAASGRGGGPQSRGVHVDKSHRAASRLPRRRRRRRRGHDHDQGRGVRMRRSQRRCSGGANFLRPYR